MYHSELVKLIISLADLSVKRDFRRLYYCRMSRITIYTDDSFGS